MSFGIDLLRHLLTVFVIIQHMASNSRYSSSTNLELAVFVNWIDCAVLGFFFMSGYLFKQKESLCKYSKKQCLKLLTPYFIVSVIYTLALSLVGKDTLINGFIKTISFQGSGMQLYYLPYLLIVTVAYAIFTVFIKFSNFRILAELLLFIIIIAACLALPTKSSTGSDFKLLFLYVASFLLGRQYINNFSLDLKYKKFVVITILILSLGLGFIDERFLDFTIFMTLFFAIESIHHKLPNSRIAGSGGVYLLHTPIINFTISTLLAYIGIQQGFNIFVSVILTYLTCLVITHIFINTFPKQRWLLLE